MATKGKDAKKRGPGRPPKAKVNVPASIPVYIVVHPILENGVMCERESEYKGKRIEYFLTGGQIKLQDK